MSRTRWLHNNFYHIFAAAAAKSLQSCLTLWDINGSPPDSPIPGILQERTLKRVAISFSNAWKWKVKMKSLSHVWPLATPWTAAYQAPPSMGVSRQEYHTFRRELILSLLKLFQNIAEEATLLNSFYEATITLIPKQDKDTTKKKIAGQYHWWT